MGSVALGSYRVSSDPISPHRTASHPLKPSRHARVKLVPRSRDAATDKMIVVSTIGSRDEADTNARASEAIPGLPERGNIYCMCERKPDDFKVSFRSIGRGASKPEAWPCAAAAARARADLSSSPIKGFLCELDADFVGLRALRSAAFARAFSSAPAQRDADVSGKSVRPIDDLELDLVAS